MNNKGFTLIELLAVFAILAGISLLTVYGISASLERQDTKEGEQQIEIMKSAAKIYFSLNSDVNCVNLSVLKENNYLTEDKKIDKLSVNPSVSIDRGSGVLTYYLTENCL